LDNFDVDDPLFQLCWRQQECTDCLRSSSSCSWCPLVCVSNILNGSSLPFFLWHGTYDRIKRLKYLQATLVLRFRVGFSIYITLCLHTLYISISFHSFDSHTKEIPIPTSLLDSRLAVTLFPIPVFQVTRLEAITYSVCQLTLFSASRFFYSEPTSLLHASQIRLISHFSHPSSKAPSVPSATRSGGNSVRDHWAATSAP
jgi:hypothetical protein